MAKVVKNVDRAELETQRASLLQEIKETQLKLTELQKSKKGYRLSLILVQHAYLSVNV